MSFTKETLTHLWSKITNLVDTKLQKPKNDIALNSGSIGLSKKNLYKPAINSNKILGNVTYELSDGKIRLNGTPDHNGGIALCDQPITAYRDIFISGWETLENVIYIVQLYNPATGNIAYEPIPSAGRTIPAGLIIEKVYIERRSTHSGDINAVLIPMICYSDIVDKSYEPYRDDLQTQVANTNLAMMGTKNILYNGFFGSFTYNGITYTRNDDGSITISGVNTESSHKIAIWNIQLGTETQHYYGSSSYGYDYTKHIPTGKYIMSLGVDTTNKLKLQLASCKTYNIEESSITIQATSNSNEITVEEDDVYNYCRLIVYGGADFSEPVTIYPMIRPIYVSDDKYVIGRKSLLTTIDTTDRRDIDINRLTLGYYKKNIIKPTLISETQAGVTCTTNSDGSVTVTGKNNSDESLFFIIVSSGNLSLNINEQYVLSGTPYNNTDADGNLMAHLRIEKPTYVVTAQTDTVEKKFNVYESTENMFMTLIVSKYGDFTDNPLTFYPMIRLNSIEDNTYEPYVPSIQELISTTKNDTALNTSSIGLSRKNLLKHNVTSQIKYTVTATANSDKTITLSGTATGGNVNIQLMRLTKNGSYILTGCPSGGGYQKYGITLAFQMVNGSVLYKADIGNGYSFDFDSSKYSHVDIYIEVKNGITVDNVTFSPMLRHSDIIDDTYEPYTDDLQTQITSARTKLDVAVQRCRAGSTSTYGWFKISSITISNTDVNNGITIGTTLSIDKILNTGAPTSRSNMSISVRIAGSTVTITNECISRFNKGNNTDQYTAFIPKYLAIVYNKTERKLETYIFSPGAMYFYNITASNSFSGHNPNTFIFPLKEGVLTGTTLPSGDDIIVVQGTDSTIAKYDSNGNIISDKINSLQEQINDIVARLTVLEG